jgi:hypothetical protein
MVSCTGRYGHTSCDMANYVNVSFYSGGNLVCGACSNPGGWRFWGNGSSTPEYCGYNQYSMFY